MRYIPIFAPALVAAANLTASQFTIDYASLSPAGPSGSRVDVVPLASPFAVDLGNGVESVVEVTVITQSVSDDFSVDANGLSVLGGASDTSFDAEERIALSFSLQTTLGNPVTDVDIDLLGVSAQVLDGDQFRFSTGGDSATAIWHTDTGTTAEPGSLSLVELAFSPLQTLIIEAGELVGLQQDAQLGSVTFQLSEAQAPNVIVFFVDDFGWPDVGQHPSLFPDGSPLYETPNLHRLAEQGVRFTHAYAQPLCSASRAALLSGQYTASRDWLYRAITKNNPPEPGYPEPSEDNETKPYLFPGSRNHMPHEVETIAERMKEAGYATWHAGKWHLSSGKTDDAYNEPFYPSSQGFDKQLGVGGSGPPSYFGPFEKIPQLVDHEGNPAVGTKKDYIADHYARLVQGLIEDHRSTDPETPFFLYYCPFSTHSPFEAKKSDFLYYQDKLQQPELAGSKHTHPVFAAQVAGLDSELGALLDYMDANNLNNNTLLFFVSDNGGLSANQTSGEVFDDIGPDGIPDIPGDPNVDGTYLSEVAPNVHEDTFVTDMAPLKGGKSSIYEGGIRVPMLVSYPRGGVQAGAASDEAVHLIDIYKTILDYTPASAKVDYILDGESLKPVLQQSGDLPERDVYVFFPRSLTASASGSPGGPGGTAVINPPYKLHANYSHAQDDATEKYELYHLGDDIGETVDIAARYPHIVDEMRKRLDAWHLETEAPVPLRNSFYNGSKNDPEISKDTYYLNAGLTLDAGVDFADPDGDGRDNITEFLQQTDPSVADEAAVNIWLYDNGSFNELRFGIPAVITQSEFTIVGPNQELIDINDDLILDGEYGELFVYRMAAPIAVNDVSGYLIEHNSVSTITPNPSSFSSAPVAVSSSEITMTATIATSSTAVEYYFAETSGNAGGTDSGWQAAATYTDAGLDAATQYTYLVRTRNASGYITSDSAPQSATTDDAVVVGGSVEYHFGDVDEISELDLRGMNAIVVSGGKLTATSTTNSPKFRIENLDLDGNDVCKLQMRLKATSAANLKFHFMTRDDPAYSSARYMTAPYETAGVSQTIEFDLMGHPQLLNDRLIDVRFTLPGLSGTEYEIDWVRIIVAEPAYNFYVDGDFEGWTINNASSTSVANGLMSGTFSGVAQILRYGLGFEGEDVSRVLVRFKTNQTGGSSNLRFATDVNSGFDQTRFLNASNRYEDSDGFEIVEFDTTSHDQWISHAITGVRMNLPYVVGERVDIDWIKFVNNPPVLLSSDDFEDGIGNWVAGGQGVVVTYEYAVDSSALAIDNGVAGASAELANVVDVSGYYDIKLDFSYVENPVYAYESGEGFEVQILNNGVWELVDSFISGVNLGTAGERYEISLIIDGLDPTEAYTIRFVGIGNDSGDKVHLDNISVSSRTD